MSSSNLLKPAALAATVFVAACGGPTDSEVVARAESSLTETRVLTALTDGDISRVPGEPPTEPPSDGDSGLNALADTFEALAAAPVNSEAELAQAASEIVTTLESLGLSARPINGTPFSAITLGAGGWDVAAVNGNGWSFVAAYGRGRSFLYVDSPRGELAVDGNEYDLLGVDGNGWGQLAVDGQDYDLVASDAGGNAKTEAVLAAALGPADIGAQTGWALLGAALGVNADTALQLGNADTIFYDGAQLRAANQAYDTTSLAPDGLELLVGDGAERDLLAIVDPHYRLVLSASASDTALRIDGTEFDLVSVEGPSGYATVLQGTAPNIVQPDGGRWALLAATH